jgi:hypothetical protein
LYRVLSIGPQSAYKRIRRRNLAGHGEHHDLRDNARPLLSATLALDI